MAAQQTHENTLERLEQQRHSLARHMADLEAQLRDSGQHHAAVSETIRRLRGKDAPRHIQLLKTT